MGRVGCHRRSLRCGAALIELALALPLLVTLFLGCVDFGRFATHYTAVTNAAREAASLGAQHPFTPATHATWQARVMAVAEDELGDVPGFEASAVSVEVPERIASHEGVRVRVQVAYAFRPVVRWPGLPDRITVSRAAEMPVVLD